MSEFYTSITGRGGVRKQMSDSFLPSTYDGVPQGVSNYTKLVDGENTFRILSSAIIGYEYWTGDSKNRVPVRVKSFDEVPSQYLNNEDNRDNAKYFWAFVVYNFTAKNIQIFEVKQKKIMQAIEALVKSKAWGDPKGYNIVITKTKTGSEPRDVDYAVMPEPKETLDEGILITYDAMKINLNALYEGTDPFQSEVDGDKVAEDAAKALA